MRARSAMIALGLSLGVTVAPAGPAAAASTVWTATQVDGVPSSFYWAVIVGARDYAGSTVDAPGADRDAWALRDHLLSIGWRADHIYVVTNLAATRDGVLKAIRWLASKVNSRSLAVFHYSGHEKPFRTTADGDSEPRDVAIWGADNRYILDGELARELAAVRAYKAWFHFSSCRAGGFSDGTTASANRVITYASPEWELAYTDPAVGHSKFNYWMIVQGMRNKLADKNLDGKVSVEEAFWYSRMPVISKTGGRQHPLILDRFSGDFSITPPR